MTKTTVGGGREAFKAAYASLNASQKKAVDTIEGPVMVVAGPGTGKTQILTLRIANILLQTDTSPDGVLALTFTESGAKAMRERLRRYIGADAYRVPIYTFHGFAQKLIAEYPDEYIRVVGGRPASDLEKIKIIEDILAGGQVKLLRPMGDPSYYVTHIQRMISQLKQEYIKPDDLAKIITNQEVEFDGTEKYHTKGAHKGKVRGDYAKLEKDINKNRELLFIYRQYEAILTTDKLYDFDDMIVETVEALETNEDLLRDLQERYLYVLADEHQDVNGSQNRILELLVSFHSSPNIFAVGDEKQAIYRFQGASLENFLHFTKHFSGTEVISLVDNYRSTQEILDLAHSLVVVEDGPLAKLRIPLTASTSDETVLDRQVFSHQAVENEWVVAQVQEYLKQGMPLSEIAVIVRTNKEVEEFAFVLRKAGLPVEASAEGDILRHPITQFVKSLIDVTVARKRELVLPKVLHAACWGVPASDLVRVLSARSYDRSVTDILGDEEALRALGVGAVDRLYLVHQILEEVRAREAHEAPHRILEFFLKASGYLDYLNVHDPIEGGRIIRRLFDEVESMVLRGDVKSLEDIGEALAIRMSYGLPLLAPYISVNTEAVQVMTAHKSKGLEFTVVIAPNLTDKNWGGGSKRRYFNIPLNQNQVNDSEFIEDERRLFYVLLTRAKRNLHLSLSETDVEGRELMPVRLLEGMNLDLVENNDVSALEKRFDPLTKINTPENRPDIDLDLVRRVLRDRGFSATSLNNYLKSPWDYFYRNVLRVPEVQPEHMQYGTALHFVLEQLTKHYTATGKIFDDTELKYYLEIALKRLPLVTEEYVRLLEKGLIDLVLYREHIASSLPSSTKEEFSVRVMLSTGLPEIPEVPLTGKLDRLDLDKDGITIRVVDYKTGKPKSRNEIEGNTKNSDGAYKRQLVFYALLLELHGDGRYLTKQGTLSFVQADSKGVIHEETFTITDEEVFELKAEIIRVTKEIYNGDFLTESCDPNVGSYCDLVELLRVTKKT